MTALSCLSSNGNYLFYLYQQNSVPHIPGATGGFSFPGIGGQLPGIPRIPAGIQPPGTTDLPTGIESPDGLPPAITGIQTGIKSPDGELNVIKSPDGIPGIPGKPTDITLNIPSSQELAKVSMGAVSLQSLPGMTEGIPGSRFLRSVEGGINEAMFSGSGLGGVRAMVAGTGAISATNEHQQEQSLPGSTLVPTGANYQLDCIPPTGITQGIGVPQQQEMRLPLNLPNSDLLVSSDIVIGLQKTRLHPSITPFNLNKNITLSIVSGFTRSSETS